MRRISFIAAVLLVMVFAGLPQTGRAGEDADAKAEQRALFRQGARLWPNTCGNCHKARPAGERSPAEWEIIMMHMRARANLPARHSDAILQYLQSR